MHDAPTAMVDDEEAVQQPKCGSRHSEEVEGGNGFTVIREERPPAPIEPEARSMPRNNGLRFDDDKRLFPAWPDPAKQNPEQPVQSTHRQTRTLPLQHRNLLPQRQHLERQVHAAEKESTESRHCGNERIEYESTVVAPMKVGQCTESR